MKKQLQFIFKNHGKTKQFDMLMEECSELIKAVLKHRRKEDANTYHAVIEEMADVTIMIQQFIIYYNCQTHINDTMREKINREILRIQQK